MIFTEIVWNIIISPLELFFETVFTLAFKTTHSAGIAILLLSLVVSTLVLPLYMRAEKIETEEREKEKELSSWVKHIKKHFKGDERYMILDAYYRENNYSPLYQLRSSISILLQIPFFIAAYDFLGMRARYALYHLSFLCFSDLSLPDGAFPLGSISINVLPVLMTMINVVATCIYTKGQPAKTVIRSLILPMLFLFLLYDSPSALLIYWTMNNLYSLVKTIIIKNMKKNKEQQKKVSCRKSRINSYLEQDPKASLFVLPMVFMSVLTGLLIPLAYLSASPEEFIDITTAVNPLSYLISSFFVSLGFFVFWPCIFYYLAGRKTRNVFSILMISASVFSSAEYLFFGTDTGMLDTTLVFDQTPVYTAKQVIINSLICLLILAAGIFLYRFKKTLTIAFTAFILTALTVSFIDARRIQGSYDSIISHIEDFREDEAPKILLSAENENVMVIMLDKAVSGYIPYVFNEFPELREQFDGFVYYPNSLNFAQITIKTSSALFGGYDYTNERMDARTDETLAEKHDEALKVLPRLFSDNGYFCSLIDLPYPGWTWNGDNSVFDDIPNCRGYHAKDFYNEGTEIHVNAENRRNRNLFLYGLFRCSPMALKPVIYDGGNYLSITSDEYNVYNLMENYVVLENLAGMTQISEDYSGGLLLFDSETTHDLTNLATFDPYDPQPFTEPYYISNGESELLVERPYAAASYECLVVALRQLGNYFDYLRELGVYDNTRIIIVSDHGTSVAEFWDLISENVNGEWFNCLFMVKDFDSEGFSTDYTFMTNADVPALAAEGIIEDPVNPYTGNPISTDPKHDDLYVSFSLADDERLWNPDLNLGNTFYYDDTCVWFKVVNENIFDKDNWILLEGRPEEVS